MTHKCCDDDNYLRYNGDCGDPDPCAERWYINEARGRKARKQGATIALIVAGVAAVVGLAFFLVAQGIVVLDDGKVVVSSNPGPAEPKDVNISADKVGITADKVIVDKDKKYKDKHD